MTELNTYYLQLKYALDGYYVKFRAPSPESVRRHADEYFGLLAGSIYTAAYFYEVVRKREQTTRLIRRTDPVTLTE